MKVSKVLYQLLESYNIDDKAPNTGTVSDFDGEKKILTLQYDISGNIPKKRLQCTQKSSLGEFKKMYMKQAIKSLDLLKATIIVFLIDSKGVIELEYISPNSSIFHHFFNNELAVDPELWIKNIHSYDFNHIITPGLKEITQTQQPKQLTYRFVTDTELIWIEANLVPEPTKVKDKIQIFAILQDITSHKRVDITKANESHLIKAMVQNSSFVAYSYDITSDKYYFVDDSIAKIILDSAEFYPYDNESLLKYIHPEDCPKFKDYRHSLIQKRAQPYFNGGSVILRFKKDIGVWSKVKLSEAITQGHPQNAPMIYGIMEDLTQIENLESQIYQYSQFDNLTKLPNRSMFIKHTSEMLDKYKMHSIQSLALVFVNINKFKAINDNLGYASGDILLSKLSKRLRLIIGENVYLSRLGVDEFALLIENFVDNDELINLSNTLIKELTQPFIVDGLEVHTTPSIGICVADSSYTSAEILIGNAGTAIQKAKERYNGGYSFYQSDMHVSGYTRFILEGEIRSALTNNEFELYYMPKYSLIDDMISGCEALIRWNSPTRGIVNPDEFIPLAQDNGMIVDIDHWVINEACKTLQHWKKNGIECQMSVNLSSRFFNEQNPVKVISDALQASGVDPKKLEIEITEGAVMKDLESSRLLLDELQGLGISIAIDDFGTGYSSLAYLKYLSINTLKIDQKFMTDLMNDTSSQAIVRSIINLAKLLEMDIVAEGVETLDQVQYLRDQDCDIIQGYLISKPLQGSKILQFFNNTNFTLSSL